MPDLSILSQCNRCPCNNDFIRTQDSIIEEIHMDGNIGYVTISRGTMGNFNRNPLERVTLIITKDTMIQDRTGINMQVTDLTVGMIVDAEFSTAMTFSIPPQSRAYRITIVSGNADFYITQARVLQVDLRNGFLYTGNMNDTASQMRFAITETTLILDRNGNPIPLRNLPRCQMVRVEHATFQTASIPPQTIAFVVQLQ